MDVRVKSLNSPSPGDAVSRADSGGGRTFYKAVVVEFINDLSYYNNDLLQETYGTTVEDEENDPNSQKRVSNPQYLNSAPRNSCILKIVSQGAGQGKPPILAYPFFPPHLCFPAKPGEQVWVVAETPTGVGDIPYWMCRVPEPLAIDDLNYTHGDRKLSSRSSLTTSEKLESSEEENENPLPGFPNGGETQETATLKPPESTNQDTDFSELENPYDIIVSESDSYKNFTPELVPRLTKRPGDMVIQGSNNTTIILGEDRGWNYESDITNSENSNAISGYDELPGFKGTIDIVVGRGRFFSELISETTKDSKGDDPENTQPRLISNERKDETSYIEVDKNPVENDLSDYPPEGDPDLARDCSRVYVSMNTNGDKNFGISNESVENSMSTGIDASIEDADESPYVVMKSDEVRIIATKNEDEDINGTIRIVKQGTKDDDLATICLLSDGTVQISGSKIYLGRSTDDGGAGGGPGAGESQPYVKYQDLEDVWNAFMDEMSTFCDTVLTHTTPGYGAPSPQLNQAVTELKANIASTHKPDIANVKSERIFGE